MKTAPATRTSANDRPLFLRAARKWYSWAGLALTMTASYLAIDGQLKLDGMNLLQASPRPNEVSWSTNQTAPDVASEQPTEAAVTEVEMALEAGPKLQPDTVPEVVAIPPENAIPLKGSMVEPLLNEYVNGQGIVLASNQEVAAKSAPNIPVPAVPTQTMPVPPPVVVTEQQPVAAQPSNGSATVATTSAAPSPQTLTLPVQPIVQSVPATAQTTTPAAPVVPSTAPVVPAIQPMTQPAPVVQPIMPADPAVQSVTQPAPVVQPAMPTVPNVQHIMPAVPAVQPVAQPAPVVQQTMPTVPTVQPTAPAIAVVPPVVAGPQAIALGQAADQGAQPAAPNVGPTVPPVAPAEPVKVIVPAPVKNDPAISRPNAPLVLPPRSLDMPANTVMQRTEEQLVQPLPAPPTPKTGAGEGELIPSKPTQEFLPNSDLAREAESLKDQERIIYLSAQNNARLKDWAKASEDFEHLLKLRPDLVYIRAEYAGNMVTAGELQKAVDLYRRVIEMKPDSVQYRIRLGDVYVIAKDYKSAARIYAEALRNPPFEPEYAVRLARAYAFDGDFNRAFQVYDRMLSNIKPDDPRAPAAMGALLLDLDMPNEAMPYLLNKRKQLEKEERRRELLILEVLGSIIRGHARLGERQLAMEAIAELPTIATDQIAIRETLAAQLIDIEEFELAAQIYNQILQLEPNNGVAIIGMARIYLEMSQPAQARQILDSFRPAPRQVRDYLATYAVYHQRVGEYIEARQIYSDMLRRNANDHEIRLALGTLYDRAFGKDEWERAKAEYAKIPPTDRFGRSARREFADVLSHQRKFQDALEIDRLLLTEDPSDFTTIAMATRHYSKAGMYDQAIALARGYLATNPRSEGQAVAVRLALARALLDARKYLDAIREYEILISRPSGRKVAAYYGLARAHEKLGNMERSKQFLACMAGLPGGEFRNRLALAELYALDYDDQVTIAICSSLVGQDPRHLPSLIRMGDSQQRQARFSGQPADAFQTAQAVLGLSNTNVRGHFVMARSFAVAQSFRKAAGQYDQIIQYDPELFAARKERARILYADHQYSAARSSWDAIQRPTADDQLIVDINDIITRNPKMHAFLQPYIVSGVAGPGLRKELGRLAVTVPDPDLRLAVHRLCCDYDARLAAQNAVRLEEDGFEVKDYRVLTALNTIPASPAFEPTNTDTLFAQGQQLGALSRNNKELGWYNQVLQVDPTHRDAQVAADRSNAEMGPKLDGIYNFFHQLGRQGLTAIDRQTFTVDGRIPLGDENEYLAIGYTRAEYHPVYNNYPNADGNIPWVRAQKRFFDDLMLGYAQVNVEQFRNGFKTRPTFDIGEIYQCCEWIWVRAGGYLENVAENGESIRQDIHRGGVYTGADFRPTRIWAFGGQYQYGHYSDNNDMNSFTLYNELAVTQPPKMLKIAERFYYWGYRESTIFPTNPPNALDLFGAVHPYFAPTGYSQGEIRLEWWHWLSRDYFVHSNQCWYSLQYGIMSDSNLVTFHNLRALLNYDVCTWFTVGASAQAQLSSVYNMYAFMGYFQIRFR